MIEIYKYLHGESPEILNSIFKLNNKIKYNLRGRIPLKSRNVKSVKNGTASIMYKAPKLWAQVPNEYKELSSKTKFKNKIKNWKPNNCPCRLCKKFIPNIGFI